MKHLQPSDFKHFSQMNPQFVELLDSVVGAFGSPITITSDWRSPAANAAASGSSPTSLHLQGRAADFALAPWSREALWKLVEAVMLCSHGKSIELELVSSAADHHVHLGLFTDVRPSRLVLSLT